MICFIGHAGERCVMLQDEEIQILNRAGLTVLQAKIYLALVNTGKATIKAISEMASTDRSDTYRTILNLQKLGLVQKIIEAPNVYEGVSLQEGVSLLLKNKSNEYHEIEEKTREMLQKFKAEKKENMPQEEFKFIMISEKSAHARRIEQAINAAQKKVDTIMEFRGNDEPSIRDLPVMHQSAIRRGVKIQLLSNKPRTNRKELERSVTPLPENRLYEVRYVHAPLPVMFCVIDEREVFFATDPKPDLNATGALWTNNHNLVAISNGYFELLWHKATRE